MGITKGVDHKESCVKVAECVSPQQWIIRKVVLKLRNAKHHRSGSYGKLCQSHRMRTTSGVDHKKRSVKVMECVSPQEWMIRRVVLKLRNAYHLRNGS